MNEKEKRMNINISEIVTAKLAQMDREGVIQRKIEETLEKTILGAITSELDSYAFRSEIGKQLRESVGDIAKDCGLSAYNGFIARKVRDVVAELYTEDAARRVQQALEGLIVQRHEGVRLSDIFRAYRKWVLENTEDAEKYERQTFTASLEVTEDGHSTKYICRFADHPLEGVGFSLREDPEVQINFWVWGRKDRDKITRLYLNGHDVKDTLKLGALTEFEAFVVNLYYNGTEIELDAGDVPDDESFDVDV